MVRKKVKKNLYQSWLYYWMMMLKVEAFFLRTWLTEGGMLRTLLRIRSLTATYSFIYRNTFLCLHINVMLYSTFSLPRFCNSVLL